MKPLQLKPGAVVTMTGINQPLKFLRRLPREGLRPAINLFSCAAYVGQNGPEDQGLCEVSDMDLRTRCQIYRGTKP